MVLLENTMLVATAWNRLEEGLGMSPRQGQIARCLFDGLSDKQIANELNVTVPTIRTHMSRLFGKLRVGDRVELILCLMNRYCSDYCPHRA